MDILISLFSSVTLGQNFDLILHNQATNSPNMSNTVHGGEKNKLHETKPCNIETTRSLEPQNWCKIHNYKLCS